MKDLNTIEEWTDKKLRTLRNNLNNRLESFKNQEQPKSLQSSHILAGLSELECKELQKKVLKILSERSKE